MTRQTTSAVSSGTRIQPLDHGQIPQPLRVGALVEGRTLGVHAQVFFATVEEGGKAAGPIVPAEGLEEPALGEHALAVVCEGAVADRAVGADIVIPLGHAEHEQDAVLLLPCAKAEVQKDGLGEGFDGIGRVVGRIVVHRHEVDAAAVGLLELAAARVEGFRFALAQQFCRVDHVGVDGRGG